MSQQQIDQKLAEGIANFEQMLQAMPEDRTTLEFLSVAYAQAGDGGKCRDALISLAKVLLKEADYESALRIAERLETFDDDLAKITALKVKAAAAPAPALTPETPSEETIAADNTVLAIREGKAAEKSLVTHLLSRRSIDDKTADSLTRHIDGVDASQLLGSFRNISPQVPVIVSSGSAPEKLKEQFSEHPYDGFLSKPYTLAELQDALARFGRKPDTP